MQFFHNKIIAGLGSGKIKVIDTETREIEDIEAKHPLDISSMALSSDDRLLLTSSVDNTFKILRTTDRKELAKSIRSSQTPVLGLPKGAASFDIGIVREGVTIPMEVPRPVFVRSSFQEEKHYFDVLKLSHKIDDHYRRLVAANPGAGLVFVDKHDFDKGYAILGRYRLNGDQVRADVQLFRDHQSMGSFAVNGRRTSVDELVQSITKAVDTLLRKQPAG